MELEKMLQNAGITGAGGAGFPSYAKLKEGIDTLLINGAECEPLLYTDYTILKKERDVLISGIEALLGYKDIKRAILLIKTHNAKPLGLSDGDSLGKSISVKLLPDVYPIGDEVSLIFEATGKVMRPGCLPASLGVIVYNVETVYNVGVAVKTGAPVTEKWLTVGGDIPEAYVLKAPIGASVSELFEKLSIEIPEGSYLVDGGPSMGKIIDPETARITKTTKGLLVLPGGIQAIESKLLNVKMSIARAETACCQCTRCTDMCPRNLLGYSLEPHKMVRTAMGAVKISPDMVISATLCCSCGICESVACSQGISPKAVIANYKALLQENKMKYIGKTDPTPEKEREYRMIPSERWQNALGVRRCDKLPKYLGKIENFESVEIALKSNVGVAARPTVAIGDRVGKGDLIAAPENALSLAQHASITGIITKIGNTISIRAERN